MNARFTIMYWPSKGELRAVRLDDTPAPTTYDQRRLGEMRPLPEHDEASGGAPPTFDTVDEAWSFIETYYPQFAP